MSHLFSSITDEDKKVAVEKLIHSSWPRSDFFLMVILSVVAASFGLFLDSVAIVIGSMLIAPILLPVISFSMGLAMSDYKLISKAFVTIVKSIVLALVASVLVSFFFYEGNGVFIDVLVARHAPLQYFLVAVVAGTTFSFALVKPDLNTLLPGAAVAVTLIPPLAAMGIGIATLNSELIRDTGLIFALNLFGIVVSSLVIFSLMNIYVKRWVAERAAHKEVVADAIEKSADNKSES